MATALQPTQLDFFEILYHRGNAYFSKEKHLYRNLLAGNKGEKIVLQLIEEFGQKDWTVLRNIWLNKDGIFECDLILITRFYLYLIEIKHYQKRFTYENGVCYYDYREMPRNGIEQARRNHVFLREISNGFISPSNVRAAILFTGNNCTVDIKTPIDFLEVKDRTELVEFIEEIAEEEARIQNYPIDTERLIARLEEYEKANPYAPTPLKPEEMTNIRKGMRCMHCHSFNVRIHQAHIECACGLHESREEATIRTICEYGVLKFGQPMTYKGLLEFFGGQISRDLLKKIVQDHFEINQNGRYTKIINKNLPYFLLTSEFTIKNPKIFHVQGIKNIIF
jgi:hypothetical protein